MDERQDLFDFGVDNMTAQELNDMSRWSRLLSILIFSLCGIVLLVLLLAGGKITDGLSQEIGSDEGASMFIVILVAVVIAIVVVSIMMYFLMRAANRIRAGIRLKDQSLFNKGLGDMKTYFTIFGVLSILGLIGNLTSLL